MSRRLFLVPLLFSACVETPIENAQRTTHRVDPDLLDQLMPDIASSEDRCLRAVDWIDHLIGQPAVAHHLDRQIDVALEQVRNPLELSTRGPRGDLLSTGFELAVEGLTRFIVTYVEPIGTLTAEPDRGWRTDHASYTGTVNYGRHIVFTVESQLPAHELAPAVEALLADRLHTSLAARRLADMRITGFVIGGDGAGSATENIETAEQLDSFIASCRPRPIAFELSELASGQPVLTLDRTATGCSLRSH